MAANWVRLDVPDPRPGPRQGASLSVLYARGQLLLFGGREGSQLFDELWRFDTERDRWSLIASNPRPAPRFGHAATIDTRRRRLVLYGGFGAAGALTDLWAFEPLRVGWQRLAERVVGPGPRAGACAAYDEVEDRFLLAFGSTGTARTNEIWSFRFADEIWEEIGPPLGRPPARQDGACFWDATTRRLIVYGGQGEGFLADAWQFSLERRSWSQVPAGRLPAAAGAATAVADDRTALLFGGKSAGGYFAGWMLDLASGEASSLLGDGGGPPPRAGGAAVYSSDTGRFYLFGGANPGELADFWSLAR
jgi:hypothetical protein